MVRHSQLHYLYDPFCGWCYGASPLIAAIQAICPVQLHGGGMFTGTRKQRITPAFRGMVRQYDQRIAALTGQHFAAPYSETLLSDESLVLDSAAPIALIQYLQTKQGSALACLQYLQKAYYQGGFAISNSEVLLACAQSFSLSQAEALAALDDEAGIQQHLQSSRQFMRQFGLAGFPALLLQHDSSWQIINLQAYYGKPDALLAQLCSLLSHPSFRI